MRSIKRMLKVNDFFFKENHQKALKSHQIICGHKHVQGPNREPVINNKLNELRI